MGKKVAWWEARWARVLREKGPTLAKALWQEGGSACLVPGEQTAGVKGEMSLKKWARP